jgi:hypothetical protein
MSLSLRILAAAGAALAAACAAALPAQAAPAGCGATSYSYAGVLSPTATSGVGARLSSSRLPNVASGHVAGWVGVGGAGMGPNSSDEWLQVGISATADAGQTLYYEVARPNQAPRYVTLRANIPVGKAFDVAVLESQAHSGSWRVWVNGVAVTSTIFLPGSHAAWRATVTAESWNGDTAGACNGYSFRFGQVRVATTPGGALQPMSGGSVIADPGYHVHRGLDTLLAAGGA